MTTTETVRITCTCKVCHGRQADVKAGSSSATLAQTSKDARHNLVSLAHSPLAMAASVRSSGPWKV